MTDWDTFLEKQVQRNLSKIKTGGSKKIKQVHKKKSKKSRKPKKLN